MNELPTGKKIFVGLSGGVDSAVVATLLKNAGNNVVGVFMRTWQPDWIKCTWRDDRRSAMRVAAHLKIPFLELDVQKKYKEEVVSNLLEVYKSGNTPNPDVLCNREVKFGQFYEWAKAHGAEYIATGHYAQIIDGELFQGVDPKKDQSYFLWTLSREVLQHTLMPLGSHKKLEIRKIATQFKLPNANRPDSQGICLLGQVDLKNFLSHYIKTEPGDVLDENGKVIGQHEGAVFYTLGQRHGFTTKNNDNHQERLYVIEKNMNNNTITVGTFKAKKNGQTKSVILSEAVIRSRTGNSINIQYRYHGEMLSTDIVGQKQNTLYLSVKNFPDTVPLGQSIVIYSNNKCIGGGILDSIE